MESFMKNKKQIEWCLKLFVVGTSLTMMTSCGSLKSDDLSSRLSPEDITSGTKPVAWCNQGNSESYSANLKAYKNANDQWMPQYIYLKFTDIPSSFSQDQRYFQFYRWMASSDGTTSLDSSALEYRAIDLNTNKVISDWKKTMGWSSLSTARTQVGVTDVAGFFKRVAFQIDLRDVRGEYDVLRIASYKTGNNLVDEDFDILMPVFYANPGDYQYEPDGRPRADVLKQLHPLRGTSLSSSEYQARTDSFCDVFSEYK